jgi:hypothetical protein
MHAPLRIAVPLLSLALSFLTARAEEAGAAAAPAWPAIGARWDAARAHADVRPEALGTAAWSQPPAVLSPYEANWFDYVPILWGEEPRLTDPVAYHALLRQMFICGGMNYSQHKPDDFAKTRLPFYCTNLANLLYLRNKPGGKIRDAYKKERTRENCIRNPSLEDPKADEEARRLCAAVAQRCAAQKPLGYDLRDEGTYTISAASPHDFDFSPVSLQHFRGWLRAKYGTLAALNAEWDTAFDAWDQVFPLLTDEIQAREFPRLARANLAPWADHREYNDDTMMAAVSRYRDAIRAIDPGAAVGYSGTQMPSAWGGFDFWKIGNTIGWIEHYDCNGSRELIRSFLPRRYPAISAIPHGSLDEGLRRMWYMALHGDAGGLIWPYAGNNNEKTLMLDVKDGKGTLNARGEIIRNIFREARSGIPCLLRHADPVVDPIGILHSQPSLRADWLFEVKRDGKSWYNRYSSFEGGHNYAAANREGFAKLLEDLGWQYTFFAGEQVARGELLTRGVKLFIVPRGIALSRAEIAGLTAFVEAGGVLVTDIMAGRMNENCRVWPAGEDPIEKLLGVRHAPFAFEEEKKSEEGRAYAGGFGRALELVVKSDFNGLQAGEKLAFQGFQEPGLQAGTARALAAIGATPALLEQPQGKGFAYTLNFDLPNYLQARAGAGADRAVAPARRVLSALVARAGLVPAVQVRAKGWDGNPSGLEVFRSVCGAAEYVAVNPNGSVNIDWEDLSDSGAGVAVTNGMNLSIRLPKKGVVTEMRSRRAYGTTDQVNARTEKDRPVILSVLPYEVRGVQADLGAGRIADGKLALKVTIQADGAPGDHVVHAELADAQGAAVPEGVINLPLPGGRYAGALDLSFVPGNGPWTLRLTDVASGKTAEGRVTR